MNENRVESQASRRQVRVWSLGALGALAVVPMAALACGGSGTPQPTTAANGVATAGTVPPGYPQQGTPPGYPAQPGYPQQPTGYPQQAPQQPGYPQQPAAYPQPAPQQPGYPQQPQPTPSAAPTALAPTDPNSLQGILNGLQGALGGQMVNPGSLGGDLTDAGLKALALHIAPGMQPEGDELKQTLSEGQHAVMMVTLQAGKCYTVVGFAGLGGVKDLDLNMLAPPLYMTLAGQDMLKNNTAAIGAAPSPMCPVIMFPLQYKLDVFAKAGSGPVAVQLYSKSK
jgi:hypothetical protein